MVVDRVLILGLDGATWRLLGPLLAEGELPNLAALVDTGSSGTLRSSIPPLTAPAWTSFQTGSHPGKHGVFDFRIFDRSTRQVRLANALSINLPTLWQIASAAGRWVIAINVPMTYPPQPINGLIVSGMLAQKEDSAFIYPPDRSADLLARHPAYRISPPVISQRGRMGRRAFVQANIEVEDRRCELALDLLQNEPWDLFMVQNQCLDYIQHAYYHLMDPTAPEFNEDGYDDVLRFFRAMDRNVGRLVNAAGENVDVVVVSDHGFKLQHRLIHLAPWLRSQGYLVEKIDWRQRALQALRRADVFKLRRHLAHRVLPNKRARFGAAATTALRRIDWERSRAFAVIGSVFGFVFINRQVEDDTDALTKELSARLSRMTDPKNGRPVVERVLLGKEVFRGPFSDDGPDLIAVPTEDYTFGAPSLVAHRNALTDIDFELEIPGGHHPDGILIWRGDGTRPLDAVQADLVDVAPTILARLGVAVPEHMDGKVLTHLFIEPPAVAFRTWEQTDESDTTAAYTSEEEQALQQRLRDLGYF